MKISKKQLSTSLNNKILKSISDELYSTNSVKSIKLLTHNRIDVLAKYLYVKFRVENINSDFAKNLYLNHINLLNGFVENDESMKLGKKSFIDNFNSLIDSISLDGFDERKILPLCANQSILDGAHRLACSIYFGLTVPVVNIKNQGFNFNLKFFRDKGLPEIYLDNLALEYSKLKENIFLVLIWPKAKGGDKELINIFNRYGKVVYEKIISLNINGVTQLVKTAYKNELWLGDISNDYEGARNKAKMCFGDNDLRVFMFESKNDLISMKEEIRAYFKIEKHAVHINDTKEETIELAKLLFNNNSVHNLNYSRIKEFNNFNNLFYEYVSDIKRSNIDKNKFILIGGVLATYGIKQSKDIDYLSSSKRNISFKNSFIEEEVDKLRYTTLSNHDLIYNPEYHFYYYQHKIVTLNVINSIKTLRNNDNDLEDRRIMKTLMNNEIYEESFYNLIIKIISISFYKRNIKYFLLKIRFILFFVLNKLKSN